MGRSKLLYLGIPFLLLIAYLMYVPAPHVNKIYIQGDLGYLAESYQFTIVSLTPRGQIAQLSSINFPYTVNDLTITPGYAYVITNDRIVYILDVGDSSHPRKLAEFSTAGIPKSIAVNGSTVYIADQAGSVHILSVTIPSLPIEVGSIVKLG